jgi:type I restriction enzyme S subunit
MVQLGEVAAVRRVALQPQEIEDGTLYVGLENIETGGRLVGVKPVTRGDLHSSKFAFSCNHLLFGKLRPYLAKVARPAFSGVCSTDILPIEPGPRLYRDYLAHYLLQPSMVRLAESQSTGANLPRLSPSVLASFEIPLPPIEEQRRIADILDKAEALRAKRREAIARLDTLAQSLFIEMFGDVATNPYGWPRLTLEESFDIARGGSPRPIDAYITDDPDGINWIMIGDASEGYKYIESTKRRIKKDGAKRSRLVSPGDFLLTNSMSFGRPYIMRTSGCIHDGWLVLSPRQMEFVPDYYYSLLSSSAVFTEFARRAPGATVKNLNIELVGSVSVPVAPIDKQKAFAKRIGKVEETLKPLRESMQRLDNLFDSLQQRAFRGEL